MVFKPGRTLKVGVIGHGHRGEGMLQILLAMPDVQVLAVCDRYEDRAQAAGQAVEKASGNAPFVTTDYRQLMALPELEAVFLFTSWQTHARLAVAAMQAGKHVATEVGGASSLEECWQLVRTAEATGKQCMMLENCCYGKPEMQLLNMVKQGLFGELLHCQGGYQHELCDEIGRGDEKRHYRLNNFLHRNGELYPTHSLGPIAKWLNINRGNRMTYLTSMATKARGLHAWLQQNRPESPLAAAQVNQGDVVTTMIKCANGESIVLVHDCTLPRPYSRNGRLQGTRGLWMEDLKSVFIKGLSPEKPDDWDHAQYEPLENYEKDHGHPLWKAYEDHGVQEGHGGMDYLVLRAFVTAIQNGTPCPIDVYDTAAWMSITCLSEQSVAMGSQPVPIPDFTNGGWMEPAELPAGPFNLDAVYPEAFDE